MATGIAAGAEGCGTAWAKAGGPDIIVGGICIIGCGDGIGIAAGPDIAAAPGIEGCIGDGKPGMAMGPCTA
jgi:hypothetical protein